MNIATRNKFKTQRGATQVEFALSMLLTMVLIFWVFEMIMVVYTYSVMANAAKEGVRYAIVHGANNTVPSGPSADDANVAAVVSGYAKMSLHDISAITIHSTWPNSNNKPTSLVQVEVTYQYVPYIRLPFNYPSIHATAAGRIVN